ncbi:hypothetical protein [Isobaculum melis]|uniref:DUF3796 domain-containing protein n=1 Tax=Isobaculum melis TaxID=142588 RepID=A0A1H9T215_9LACT|nr:hypothetical protein [Isobaculum melis]SER91188.1 hypothetical protein SAMN04488559_11068 [Isobaculum melis]
MTYYSKKAILSGISSIVVFIFFYLDVIGKTALLSVDSLAVAKQWGMFFVYLLLAEIVVKIVVMIIFNLINTMMTRESEPKIVDERDQLIELKSVRNFCFTFAIGFFLAMSALALNQSINMMFVILAFSFIIAGTILEASYVFFYEREA